jgi:DNA-binding MarR family transcriptional regulator
VEDSTDPRFRAWSLVIDTYALLISRFAMELEEKAGMSLSWFDVLANLLIASKNQMRMGDLAERTVISFSRVSRVVDELARRGLVERMPDRDDRRAVIVRLTPAGRKLQLEAGRIHMRGIQEHFGTHLTDRQAQSIVAALEAVLSAHDRTPSPTKPWSASAD